MPLLAHSHAAPLPSPALGDHLAESQAVAHAAEEAATAVSALVDLATPPTAFTATELSPASTLATLLHAPSPGAEDLTPAHPLADSHAVTPPTVLTDPAYAPSDAEAAAAMLPLTLLHATSPPLTALLPEVASVRALAAYPATAAER